jgi:hypothetical protein
MSIDLLAELLHNNMNFVGMEVADFSEADMLVRPCPGANHTTWQIGHLTVAEAGMVAGFGAPVPAIPDAYKAKFTKETAKSDDASLFPKKAETLEQFTKVRSATVAWAKTLKEADLARQSPEKMRQWCPTLGHLLTMLPVHVAMHVGQIQVIRRKLGKPILF